MLLRQFTLSYLLALYLAHFIAEIIHQGIQECPRFNSNSEVRQAFECLAERWSYGRLWGDFIVTFQYFRRTCKKDGDRPFSSVQCVRTGGSDFKLKEGRFISAIRKIFTMRVVRQCNRLPRGVWKPHSWKCSRLDGTLNNQVL